MADNIKEEKTKQNIYNIREKKNKAEKKNKNKTKQKTDLLINNCWFG